MVESCVSKGNTVNLYAIDLSKAFDKLNLHASFRKLMKRYIPIQLLCVLESMLFDCCSCAYFAFMFGVRQGSVFAPLLFTLMNVVRFVPQIAVN